jgi:hypothetical protein
MISNTYKLFVDEVIDGSTFTGWIDCGFDIRIRRKIKLINIKCYDPSIPQGATSKQFVEDAIRGKRLYVKTFHDKYRKYATVLAVVYIDNGESAPTNLNDLLIEHEMAHLIREESTCTA